MDRKGFNFFKSYYDVAKELTDKDRLMFYDALVKRQFTGEETILSGMANFAYISQRHNIDSQVIGYCKKMNIPTPTQGGSVGGVDGGTQGGSVQEEVIGKEEVQYVKPPTPKGELNETELKFLIWYNSEVEKKTGKSGQYKTLSRTDKNNLKQLRKSYDNPIFWVNAFNAMWESEWCKETGNRTPTHLLRVDNFNKYMNLDNTPKKFIGVTNDPNLDM